MSYKHTVCPRCRKNGKDNSGDNLAVYPDHVFCFSCGYYAKSTTSRGLLTPQQSIRDGGRYSPNLVRKDRETSAACPSLPVDFVLSLPSVGLDWIKKYEITDREIIKNRIGWSERGFQFAGVDYAPCMIFPVYDVYGNLLMWQARYFGEEKRRKYITWGKPNEVIHTIGTSSNKVVVVEDIVSAIKVARKVRSAPLFGSNASMVYYHRLSRTYTHLSIWLDPDKTVEANRLAKRVSLLFKSVNVIVSQVDPKEVPTNELERYI